MGDYGEVWEYDVEPDEFTVDMPRGGKVLSVAAQRDRVQMWALVDPGAAKETRRFRLAGTGHALSCPEELRFIGTFQMHGGSLVFHLFERVVEQNDATRRMGEG